MDAQEISIVDEPKVGTATWMIPPTVKEVFPYSEGAVWLGRNGDDARTPIGRKDESHVLLCAMNRSAKGRAIITNNLLLWKGSVVCNDPKGENASVTAARRGQGSKHVTKPLGQKVCVLDSHGTAKVDDQYRAYYNVLDELDPNDPDTPSKAWDIAESFITDDAKKDGTWDEMAKPYMRAILLHIITAPVSKAANDGNIPADERDLITFRRFILRGDFYAEEYFKARKTPEELANRQISGHKLLLQRMTKNMAFGGIIADEAESRLKDLEMHDRFFNSVRSSAVNATAWIDDPMIRDVLRAGKYQNTFRAAELETDPNGVSVFVCLRLKEQKKLAAWPRLIMNMVLASAQEDYFRSPATGHNTLMMLDEFAALERMQSVENAAPAIAGAGIKLFMVLQNLSQMKAVYGENFEAFMANAGTHIYYGFNDNFTAEYVKKRLGEIEVIRHMRTSSKGKMQGGGESRMDGEGKNTGTSSSVTRGWSPSLFHLSLFTSKQRAKNQNTGSSESWSETVSKQHSETDTSGWTQQLHKKPLADVHELMQMFGAIEDTDAPNFPGIGLVSTAEKAPALVQKSFYDLDRAFEGMFDPHPKHGFTPLPVPETPAPQKTVISKTETSRDKMESRFSGLPEVEPSQIFGKYIEKTLIGTDGETVGRTFGGYDIHIFPDSQSFFVATANGPKHWDIHERKLINGVLVLDDRYKTTRVIADHTRGITAQAGSQGQIYVAKMGQKYSHIPRLSTFGNMFKSKEIKGDGSVVGDIAFHDSGRKILVSSKGSITSVDVDSMEMTKFCENSFSDLLVSKDEQILWTISIDSGLVEWDLRTLEKIREQKHSSIICRYGCISKSHDERILVISGMDAGICVWSLDEFKTISETKIRLGSHASSISPDGEILVTFVNEDFCRNRIVFWNVSSMTPIAISSVEDEGVFDIEVSPNGAYALSSSNKDDGQIHMWDIRQIRRMAK